MQQIGFLCAANPSHKMVGTTKFNFIFLVLTPRPLLLDQIAAHATAAKRSTFVLVVVSVKTKIELKISYQNDVSFIGSAK